MSQSLLISTSPDRLQAIDAPRPVRQRRDPEPVAEAFLRVVDVVVRDGGVGGNAVVPQRHGTFFPSNTDLEILSLGYVLQR